MDNKTYEHWTPEHLLQLYTSCMDHDKRCLAFWFKKRHSLKPKEQVEVLIKDRIAWLRLSFEERVEILWSQFSMDVILKAKELYEKLHS